MTYTSQQPRLSALRLFAVPFLLFFSTYARLVFVVYFFNIFFFFYYSPQNAKNNGNNTTPPCGFLPRSASPRDDDHRTQYYCTINFFISMAIIHGCYTIIANRYTYRTRERGNL